MKVVQKTYDKCGIGGKTTKVLGKTKVQSTRSFTDKKAYLRRLAEGEI